VDTRFRPLRAVIFVLLCVGLLVFTYLLVFRVDFGGSTTVTVRFASVGTIQPGSPVRQSGVKVGSVSRVALASDDRRQVDVELSLYKEIVVRTGDKVSIVTGGLLGDQYIDILPGPTDAPVAGPTDRLSGQGGLDLKALVDGGGDLVKDLGSSTKVLSAFLATHTDALDRILADAERGTRAAADAAEKANAVLARADRLLAKAETSAGPVLGDVRATLGTLRETAASLKTLVDGLGAPGTVAGLLAAPATAKTTAETLANLQAASQSLKKVTEALEAALK